MDSFFGIGMFELIMIAVIALLVLGPERLPKAMREVAGWLKQLRNMSNEFQSQFSDELKMLDELNPRRILNEALDPNAKPAQPAAPAKPVTPAKPAAIAGAAAGSVAPPAAPVVEPAPPPIPNAETTHTILPPPVLSVPNEAPAVSAGPAEAPAVDITASQPADPDANGAEAVR